MIEWLENRRLTSGLITILIVIEIFYFSSIPGFKTTTEGINLSALYHLIIFFLLNFFLLITVHGKKEVRIKPLMLVIIISLAYAILDELHQIFVPFRYPDLKDILVDSAGIFISTITYLTYKNKSTKTL